MLETKGEKRNNKKSKINISNNFLFKKTYNESSQF